MEHRQRTQEVDSGKILANVIEQAKFAQAGQSGDVRELQTATQQRALRQRDAGILLPMASSKKFGVATCSRLFCQVMKADHDCHCKPIGEHQQRSM